MARRFASSNSRSSSAKRACSSSLSLVMRMLVAKVSQSFFHQMCYSLFIDVAKGGLQTLNGIGYLGIGQRHDWISVGALAALQLVVSRGGRLLISTHVFARESRGPITSLH